MGLPLHYPPRKARKESQNGVFEYPPMILGIVAIQIVDHLTDDSVPDGLLVTRKSF
jgi:hypothetical protein